MEKNILGNIAQIETAGLLDGPGVRVVIFLQGCNLRCLYCHNPETWDFNTQKNIYTPKKLVDFILDYKPYIKNGGVTFSGGEPLLQAEFIKECAILLKKENIHIAVDTNGNVLPDKELIDLVDLFLLDIKSTTLEGFEYICKGNISTLSKFINLMELNQKQLWLRQVIVPTINDTKENIVSLANFIKDIKNVEKIELLPYSKIGENKYKSLNINYPLKNIPDMDKKVCLKLQQELITILNKN